MPTDQAGTESLRGKIPGLLHIEVGFDFVHADTSAIWRVIRNWKPRALDAYSHTGAQAVIPLIRATDQ